MWLGCRGSTSGSKNIEDFLASKYFKIHSSTAIFWNIYRIIGSTKKFGILFFKINIQNYVSQSFKKNHINVFSHLKWRNELFYTFRGHAPYCTIHCISRCYRYLNRREFFTLTQISKNWCQITPLTTICLPKRCSGNIGTFGDLSQKWKSSEIKPLLG